MEQPSSRAAHRRWRLPFIAAAALTMLAGIAAVALSSASAATVNPSAFYVFVNRNSGKAMDVWEWSTADGGHLRQFTRTNANNQQFQFVDVGSGYYQIRSRHSGKAIEIPNSNDGVQVIQNAPSSVTRQHFRLVDSDSGYVRFISRHSNKALEMWAWSTVDGGVVSQFADLNGANQQWQLVQVGTGGTTPTTPGGGGGGGGSTTGLVGWGTQGGGTTGGGSAAATTVTSSSALSSAVSGSTARVVRISGNISCSGMITVGSNKSILGNSGATLTGCGLNVSNASNVIIRNINFTGWNDDAINVQYSTRVWIDHNSLSNGYDGAIDIKRASDFVTVSWNRIFNHDKSMLLGHSDDNAGEDVGHLRVTYHHNWFDGGGQRHPRVRFGNPVHVYNNYYDAVSSYGVASTEGAGVLVEGNYFENTDDPYHLGEGDSGPGTLVARNNTFVNSGSGQAGGSVASIPYSYSLEASGNVKASVMAGAGAGRISV
jgi:pectate lyase